MDFWKSVKWGVGSFSIQKFILQILVLYIVFLDGFRKNQYHFLERPFGIVPKIHPIWYYLGLGGRFAGRAASFSLEWDVFSPIDLWKL